MRINDTINRYGGEEFILLLPETNAKEAKIILERILDKFSKVPFKVLDGESKFYCTFSAGVHEVNSDELDIKKNIEIVDGALYEAKNEGRSMVRVVPLNNVCSHKKLIHVGIIDDDQIIRTMLGDLISKSKFTEESILDIKSFKDGMEFFESNWHSKKNEPYLIILDGMMNRMDGLEVLQKLRGLRYQERFTIIMPDPGWHYQMNQCRHALSEGGITQSMSRNGNCYDNAIMENFFGIMKSELLYLKEFESVEHFKQELAKSKSKIYSSEIHT